MFHECFSLNYQDFDWKFQILCSAVESQKLMSQASRMLESGNHDIKTKADF